MGPRGMAGRRGVGTMVVVGVSFCLLCAATCASASAAPQLPLYFQQATLDLDAGLVQIRIVNAGCDDEAFDLARARVAAAGVAEATMYGLPASPAALQLSGSLGPGESFTVCSPGARPSPCNVTSDVLSGPRGEPRAFALVVDRHIADVMGGTALPGLLPATPLELSRLQPDATDIRHLSALSAWHPDPSTWTVRTGVADHEAFREAPSCSAVRVAGSCALRCNASTVDATRSTPAARSVRIAHLHANYTDHLDICVPVRSAALAPAQQQEYQTYGVVVLANDDWAYIQDGSGPGSGLKVNVRTLPASGGVPPRGAAVAVSGTVDVSWPEGLYMNASSWQSMSSLSMTGGLSVPLPRPLSTLMRAPDGSLRGLCLLTSADQHPAAHQGALVSLPGTVRAAGEAGRTVGVLDWQDGAWVLLPVTETDLRQLQRAHSEAAGLLVAALERSAPPAVFSMDGPDAPVEGVEADLGGAIRRTGTPREPWQCQGVGDQRTLTGVVTHVDTGACGAAASPSAEATFWLQDSGAPGSAVPVRLPCAMAGPYHASSGLLPEQADIVTVAGVELLRGPSQPPTLTNVSFVAVQARDAVAALARISLTLPYDALMTLPYAATADAAARSGCANTLAAAYDGMRVLVPRASAPAAPSAHDQVLRSALGAAAAVQPSGAGRDLRGILRVTDAGAWVLDTDAGDRIALPRSETLTVVDDAPPPVWDVPPSPTRTPDARTEAPRASVKLFGIRWRASLAYVPVAVAFAVGSIVAFALTLALVDARKPAESSARHVDVAAAAPASPGMNGPARGFSGVMPAREDGEP
ncbi:unnamed protein product [Pedinophyceae sp. YPF-701]|nr:unnamed protein product [Pedinophyceae sp. YPF-701]